MGFCPFSPTRENCSKDCELYTTDVRNYSGVAESKKVEGCVFVLDYEEQGNHSRQNSMLHKEVGESKNINLYTALTMLGSREGARLLAKKAHKLIEIDNANITPKDS